LPDPEATGALVDGDAGWLGSCEELPSAALPVESILFRIVRGIISLEVVTIWIIKGGLPRYIKQDRSSMG